MKGDQESGFVSQAPVDPVLLAALSDGMPPLRTGVSTVTSGPTSLMSAFEDPVRLAAAIGTRVEILMELAGVKAAIRTWHSKQPDQVLVESSAFSARLTELWTDLQLVESHDRQYTRLRTQQVTPILEELDRQYRLNTSRIALMRQDLDMVR
jgi:hypothetical protein